MRDPKRIERFCNELKSVWACVPDWRFGQLMNNMFRSFYADTKRDIFYVEDDDLMEYFIKYIGQNTPYNIVQPDTNK